MLSSGYVSLERLVFYLQRKHNVLDITELSEDDWKVGYIENLNLDKKQMIPIKTICINLKTNEEVRFDTLTEAGRYIMNIRGGKLSTLISHIGNSIVGRGLSKSAYGYKWVYKETSNDYPDKE